MTLVVVVGVQFSCWGAGGAISLVSDSTVFASSFCWSDSSSPSGRGPLKPHLNIIETVENVWPLILHQMYFINPRQEMWVQK